MLMADDAEYCQEVGKEWVLGNYWTYDAPKWIKTLSCRKQCLKGPAKPPRPPKWIISSDELEGDYQRIRAERRANEDAEIERLWPEHEAYKAK